MAMLPAGIHFLALSKIISDSDFIPVILLVWDISSLIILKYSRIFRAKESFLDIYVVFCRIDKWVDFSDCGSVDCL